MNETVIKYVSGVVMVTIYGVGVVMVTIDGIGVIVTIDGVGAFDWHRR